MLKIKKQEQRAEIKSTLKAMEAAAVTTISQQLHEQLINSPYWQKASLILAYLSMEGEVVTDPLLVQALQTGKSLGVPRIQGDDLVFYTVTEQTHGQYVYNQFQIREPDPGLHTLLDAEMLSRHHVLLLTPGLAFDSRKGRLGRGKGYYDRTIRSLRGMLGEKLVVMGICFDSQLVSLVVKESWDETVDVVITEKKCI